MRVDGHFSHNGWHEILTSQFRNGISPDRIKLQSPAKAQAESISRCLRLCISRSFGFGLIGNKTNGKKDEIYFRYCYLAVLSVLVHCHWSIGWDVCQWEGGKESRKKFRPIGEVMTSCCRNKGSQLCRFSYVKKMCKFVSSRELTMTSVWNQSFTCSEQLWMYYMYCLIFVHCENSFPALFFFVLFLLKKYGSLFKDFLALKVERNGKAQGI